MQDVEALYRAAVTSQESAIKRKAHLQAHRDAAAVAAEQRRQQVAALDARMGQVQAERTTAEEALLGCNAALEEAFARVASQVS